MIELTLSSNKLALFGFLKSTPTQAWKNGKHFKFIYFEPIGEALTDFHYKGLYVAVKDEKEQVEGWKLIRDLEIALASSDLLTILKELEVNKLTEQRQGLGVELKGWVFDLICNGIYTRYETSLFVRLLFVNGYSFSQLVDLFSAIVKRKDLASYFLEVATKFYKEVAFE
ncbi:Phage protein [Streptococcus mitis]|uniref:Phage protein n=1 Tax=Streptococcus mitis TaxID=28037 RepID=A0A139PLR8_STRMT|nr:Phage protein [Streptococcus mitis]